MTQKKFSLRRKYLSITTAIDWFAMYDDGKQIRFLPVVCWASHEDTDGGSGVVGLVVDENFANLCEAEDIYFFDGYMSLREMMEQLDAHERKTQPINPEAN